MSVLLTTDILGAADPCWVFVELPLELPSTIGERRELVAELDRVGEIERELTIAEALHIARIYAGTNFGDDDERNGIAAAFETLVDVIEGKR